MYNHTDKIKIDLKVLPIKAGSVCGNTAQFFIYKYMAKKIDIKDFIGLRFYRLLVLGKNMVVSENTKKIYVNCLCDCGNTKTIRLNHVINEKIKSCGCLLKEMILKPKTHGMSKTRIYRIHRQIINRCCNINASTYYKYGKKGVTIAESWKKFENFKKWAFNSGYKDTLSIDRIDNSKGYFPENCRWVDSYTQANNKTNNRIFTYQGTEYTLATMCRVFNKNYKNMYKRLVYSKWTVEKAMKKEDILPVNLKLK